MEGVYRSASRVLTDPTRLGAVYREAWGREPRLVLAVAPPGLLPPDYMASLVAGARRWEKYRLIHVSEVVREAGGEALVAALYGGSGEESESRGARLEANVGLVGARLGREEEARAALSPGAARRLVVDAISTISKPTVVLVPPGWLSALGEELLDVAYSNGKVAVVAYADERSAATAGRLAASDETCTIYTPVSRSVVNRLDNLLHWAESRLEDRLRGALTVFRSSGARYTMVSLASPLLAAHAVAYAAAMLATLGDNVEPGEALIRGVHFAKRRFITPGVVKVSLRAARVSKRSWWKLGLVKRLEGYTARSVEGPVLEMARLYRSEYSRYARLASQYSQARLSAGGALKRSATVKNSDAEAFTIGSS